MIKGYRPDDVLSDFAMICIENSDRTPANVFFNTVLMYSFLMSALYSFLNLVRKKVFETTVEIITKIVWRLKNKLFYELKRFIRFFLKNSINTPYLSGDFFASLADLSVDERNFSNFTQIEIEKARVIFVTSHFLEEFLTLTQEFETKYEILIAGNSDFNFLKPPKVPDHVKRVYLQNVAFHLDTKYRLLPIGLENLKLGASGLAIFHKKKAKARDIYRVLLPPMSPTNLIRKTILEQVVQDGLIEVKSKRLGRFFYFRLLKKYKFVFVCEGNGYDTHRLWEVLYQNSYPVVLKTPWSQNLKEFKLPILYIEDVSSINRTVLEDFYVEHMNFDSKKCPVLWNEYWEMEFNQLLGTRSGN